MDHPDEMTGQERAALLAWWFAHGEGITVAQAAKLAGLSWTNARNLLSSLARVIPIYEDAGVWQVCALAETA